MKKGTVVQAKSHRTTHKFNANFNFNYLHQRIAVISSFFHYVQNINGVSERNLIRRKSPLDFNQDS